MREELKKILAELPFVFGIILIVMLIVLLIGCAPNRMLQTASVADSTNVKVIHLIDQVKDTVYVDIPQIIERNVTRDTTSHIENEYAKSDAMIDDGLLWHTLETKPQKKIVEIIKEIEYVERDAEHKKVVVEYVDRLIEKDDTKFEKIQKTVFWMVLTSIIIWICYAIIRNKCKFVSILKWIKDKIL